MCLDGEEDPVTLLLLGWMWKTQGLVLRLQSSFSFLPNVISTGASTSHSYSCDLPALKLEGKKKCFHAHNLSIPHRHKPNPIFFPSSGKVLLRSPDAKSLDFPPIFFSSHLSWGGGVGGWACWYLKTEGLPGMWGPRNRKHLICWPWII